MNYCTETEFMHVFRTWREHISIKTDVKVAFLIFRFSKEKQFFFEISLRGLKKKFFFFFKIHRNELRFKNNRQNALKPKYVVNGYYAHLWFTSDDFLKNFRVADDFFR